MTLARMILVPALLLSAPALGSLFTVAESEASEPTTPAVPCLRAAVAQPGFALLAEDAGGCE